MTTTNPTLPVEGACVVHFSESERRGLGRVTAVSPARESAVRVHWFSKNESEWLQLSELRSGFMPGMDVVEVPRSSIVSSMGEGTVVKTRKVAGHEQVLVEFADSGHRAWLPWQNLSQVKGVRHRYILGEQDGEEADERLRLRTLAWALQLWNENTGALARFDIDPLPHQIHLVHHLLASGDLNWLIADDVGLGKTIETGLLLAALRQRKQAKRVLLITPAGLTKQWQEELYTKFGMGEFRIYGDDFSISDPRHWAMYDCVIGSMDRFKNEDNLELLLQAEPWDLVIFDEAHRLTRRQYGMKYDSSQRFDLARAIRSRAESVLLLTATPHQGRQDSFTALLELLHPERKQELLTLDMNPEILQDMVFRNRKADVTDLDGNFIFHGKTTKALKVPVSDAAHDFDASLQRYLKRGYQAGEDLGRKGNAIGFVMTVYRKLASSSIASIHDALERRRERLKREHNRLGEHAVNWENDREGLDLRFEGESEESMSHKVKGDEFFSGEMDLLNPLIEKARELKARDSKLELFLDEVVEVVLKKNSDEKVLVFSEYRGTQEWLRQALDGRYGEGKTVLINGSMNLADRRHAIAQFEGDAQFLLSTEAGGEGINLQQRCHVMVNYDLPWNPMRLVQRIGRLYRYGQKKRVVVFNIHSPDTLDEQIIDILYSRLDQVVADMAPVGEEYSDSMKDDVLGEIADLVDVEEILLNASADSISRTEARIDEALYKARDAAEKQSVLFQHVAGFNASEMQESLKIDETHLKSFVLGMFSVLGVEIVEQTHKGGVWQVKLPEAVMQALGTRRSRMSICFRRDLALVRDNLHMIDTESWLLEFLFCTALSHEFRGKTAIVTGTDSAVTFMPSVLRWQDDRGRRVRQEFALLSMNENGAIALNQEAMGRWLLDGSSSESTGPIPERAENESNFKALEKAAFARLNTVCNQKLLPDSVQWVAGAWVHQV